MSWLVKPFLLFLSLSEASRPDTADQITGEALVTHVTRHSGPHHWRGSAIPADHLGCVAGAALSCLAILSFSSAWRSATAVQADVHKERHVIQYFYLASKMYIMATGTAIIPESYDLVHQLGYSAVGSGWLIGCWLVLDTMVSVAVQPLLDRVPQSSLKVLNFAGFSGFAISSLLYAFASEPPSQVTWSADLRFALLILARLLLGACDGATTILTLQLYRATPKLEMVWYATANALLITLGIGLGPLISSLVGWVLPPQAAANHRAAVTSYAFAAGGGFVAFAFCALVPTDFQPLYDAKLAADSVVGSTGLGEDADERSLVLSTLSDQDRRGIWLKGIIYGMERAFMVSALEALTALALEEEFRWSPTAAGFAIGISFLTTIPITLVAGVLRKTKWLSDLSFMKLAACSSALASLLLFPQLANVLVVPPEVGASLMLVADGLIFANGYLANGVMDGLALSSALPSATSFFNAEYYYIVSEGLQNSVGRLLGPPVARQIFALHGRAGYAVLQLTISSFGCLACISVTSAVQGTKNNSKEDDGFQQREG